ncbi:MAG: 50S ribosomal protein L15 [bacterium]
MDLSNLSPGRKKKPPRRLGRGESSGRGKTAGKGHKGQNSRSGGGKTHPAFEGGQMPYARRVPKRGFKNIFREAVLHVNVAELNRFPADSEVGVENLKQAGLVKRKGKVKILGSGELDRPLTVKAHAFSVAARAKIEAAGGKAEVV